MEFPFYLLIYNSQNLMKQNQTFSNNKLEEKRERERDKIKTPQSLECWFYSYAYEDDNLKR